MVGYVWLHEEPWCHPRRGLSRPCVQTVSGIWPILCCQISVCVVRQLSSLVALSFFESSLIWSYWRGDALGIIFLSAKLTRCLAFLFTCCIACKILVISCVSRHLLLMLLFHCIACGRSPASWPRVVAEKLGRSDTEGMYYQTVMLILFLFYFHRCISDWCITVYLFKKTVVDVVVRRTLNH